VKYLAIYRNKSKYPIKTMCGFFGVSRSGYYNYVAKLAKADKDEVIGKLIAKCQNMSKQTYGYRRICIWLQRQGIKINHKAVLRIMNKYGLLSEIRRRKKHRRMSEQNHKYENLLNRDFRADFPNKKWVTDIGGVMK